MTTFLSVTVRQGRIRVQVRVQDPTHEGDWLDTDGARALRSILDLAERSAATQCDAMWHATLTQPADEPTDEPGPARA